ncbi:MAG: K(+)-transporting ATPase subunit F [Prolixibacteraceae bacterium]|jgi:K+-transporting ATPase KdpF subunit|nr:K(+)-transporting ATPase subunit F [Prolixibacteraceae bacterium]
MNSTILMNVNATGTPGGYTIGAIIALLLLGYLFYSLIKPEKF